VTGTDGITQHDADDKQSSSLVNVLRDFLLRRMRMSHIYQPLMLKTLILGGGKASIREIASKFLSHYEAQLEYYEEITKRMPGKVLTTHGLVEREGNEYRLTLPTDTMSVDDRAELITICEAKVAEYIQRRGAKTYDHRRTALGDLSGTVRYEVLKRARFRCELCGVAADEMALEVDHIIPRKHGGKDVIENLQALCWRCNANKGDRDATDFRAVRAAMELRLADFPFCTVPASRVIDENTLGFAMSDANPMTPMHTVVVSKRHAETWFDLSEPERRAIGILMDAVSLRIKADDRMVAGFNIGLDSREVAGRTVPHAHVQMIPRRPGDIDDPRSGVRSVIPERRQQSI
jgi:ATP adenylyltransferase